MKNLIWLALIGGIIWVVKGSRAEASVLPEPEPEPAPEPTPEPEPPVPPIPNGISNLKIVSYDEVVESSYRDIVAGAHLVYSFFYKGPAISYPVYATLGLNIEVNDLQRAGQTVGMINLDASTGTVITNEVEIPLPLRYGQSALDLFGAGPYDLSIQVGDKIVYAHGVVTLVPTTRYYDNFKILGNDPIVIQNDDFHVRIGFDYRGIAIPGGGYLMVGKDLDINSLKTIAHIQLNFEIPACSKITPLEYDLVMPMTPDNTYGRWDTQQRPTYYFGSGPYDIAVNFGPAIIHKKNAFDVTWTGIVKE
jgi:hypothetical protein